MKKQFLLLSFFSMILMACGGEESSKNHSNDQESGEESTAVELVEPMENPEELFAEYSEKCQQLIDEPGAIQDASSLRTEGFSSKYQREQPEEATNWNLVKVLHKSDMQLGMHIESWFDGTINHYLVSMDEFGFIHQFDFLGTSIEATFECNPISEDQFLLTERKGYKIIDGEIYDGLNVENTIYELAGQGYVATKEFIDTPEFGEGDKFNLYIGAQDLVINVDYVDVPAGKALDLYMGSDFLTRLQWHNINNWEPDIQEPKYETADYNSDGTEDVMITLQAITGVGPDGVIPFDATSIYFQDDYYNFFNRKNIDEQLTEGMSEEEIKELCKDVSPENL